MRQLSDHFHEREFVCPLSGSVHMDQGFIDLLEMARLLAEIPFHISPGGGYRSAHYNADLIRRGINASKKSAHLKGMAADILVNNGRERYLIVTAALHAGFTRVEVGKHHIHLDSDPDKDQRVIWTE